MCLSPTPTSRPPAAGPPVQPRGEERGGFALVMVVLLLFSVAVAGATGYQLVSAENELAMGSEAQDEALAVARAGLERFVGEHIGFPTGTTTYAIDVGSVSVTKKKLAALDTITDLYLLEATGTIPDARYPASPAKRTVRQYAKLHTMPFWPKGTLMTMAGTVNLSAGSEVLGINDTDDARCASGGSNNIYGVVQRTTAGTTSGTLTNNRLGLGSAQAVIDTARVRWSILKNSQFPVGTLDGSSLPSNATFDALPSDSFPIVRVNGNISTGALNVISGRGVLIITGTLTVSGFISSFSWDGIVLASATATTLGGTFSWVNVDGVLFAGMDAVAPATLTLSGTSRIENCTYNIKRANRSIAYFELLDGTRWEF